VSTKFYYLRLWYSLNSQSIDLQIIKPSENHKF